MYNYETLCYNIRTINNEKEAMDIFKQIELAGIIPMVRLEKLENALPLMGALTAGGINLCEVAFRTQIAKDAINLINQKCSNMTVGASTVLSTSQVDDAINAGAKFIVTAGFNEKVVDYCLEKGIPIIPGVCTPSEIEKAYCRDIYVVKFFPAVQSGGVEMLKVLAQPYPFMRFLPTGGINQDNLNEYLSFNRVLACGGSYMVKDDLIKNNRYDEITKLARQAINSMLNLKIDHIGLNASSKNQDSITTSFATLLGAPFVYEEGEKIGDIITIFTTKKHGKNGCISFSTPHLERAMHYLEKRGFSFCRESIVKDNGKMNGIYTKEDIGGFAISLVKSN